MSGHLKKKESNMGMVAAGLGDRVMGMVVRRFMGMER